MSNRTEIPKAASYCPATLDLIRQHSRQFDAVFIGSLLGWESSRVERVAAIHGIDIAPKQMDVSVSVLPPPPSPIRMLTSLEQATTHLRPRSLEFIHALKRLQRGTDEFVPATALMGSLDCSADALKRRVKNVRVGLAHSRFMIVGKAGAIGHGYRLVELDRQ